MKNTNYTEISRDDYKKIESTIDTMENEDEFILAHKSLIGKFYKSIYRNVDCGVEFIVRLLSRDMDRIRIYSYSKGAKKFIQSKYLSDYFKNSIRELISKENPNAEVINTINSDKTINDMSEEEIKTIYYAVNNPIRKEVDNVSDYFIALLYRLNGEGIVSFIKNNIDNVSLANYILRTSALGSAEYYSGRGVNYNDLNENNLFLIYKKLRKYDTDYANEFVKMVQQMRTLGATEFIKSFESFAKRGFNADFLKTESSNFSLYENNEDALKANAFASTMSYMSRNRETDAYETEEMKRSFKEKIVSFRTKNNLNYIKKNANKGVDKRDSYPKFGDGNNSFDSYESFDQIDLYDLTDLYDSCDQIDSYNPYDITDNYYGDYFKRR